MGLLRWTHKIYERKMQQKEGISYVNIVNEAREINSALNAAGLHTATEEGESLRKIAVLELLEKRYPFFKNYKQDAFIKIADDKTVELIEKAEQRKLLASRTKK